MLQWVPGRAAPARCSENLKVRVREWTSGLYFSVCFSHRHPLSAVNLFRSVFWIPTVSTACHVSPSKNKHLSERRHFFKHISIQKLSCSGPRICRHHPAALPTSVLVKPVNMAPPVDCSLKINIKLKSLKE